MGQHPHRIEQLNRIEGLMDIAFDHRTIDASLAPFLDVFVFGMFQQVPGNALPSMRGESFGIRVEGRFSKSFVSNADSAKTPQRPGIINMKSQLFIGKRVKAHNHRRPDHLIGTHSLCPCILFFNLTLVEILKNIVTNGKSIIDELADDCQLHFLGVTGSGFNQGHLFLLFLALFLFISIC